MNMKRTFYRLIILLAVMLTYGLSPIMAEESRKFKVLVVMSYEEDFPWCREIREGIEPVLKNTCEITYFYMETKKNFNAGSQKAKEAFELFQQLKPDGVIAADDDAQAMLVLPYLKDTSKTPVVFCGVNAEPEKYGYPASNITGVLERLHFRESLSLVQMLVPSVRTFAYMIKESPVGALNYKQIEAELTTFPAKFVGAKFPKTLDEALAMIEEIKDQSDTLVLSTMTGITDRNNKILTDKEVIPIIAKKFGKSVIGTEQQVVKAGALCSVLRTGQEQGQTSAEMLLKAMQGTPVSQIPITRNHYGKRILNVQVMKELGIVPKPMLLQGIELVRTEE